MMATTDRCQQHPARCFYRIFHVCCINNKRSRTKKKETNVTYHHHWIILNGCSTHYHHQHQHWRNSLCQFVWSSHSFFILILICTWWWKSRVHAYNDNHHDNVCRYKRIVSWLIFIPSNTSRRQVGPLYEYNLIAFYHENVFSFYFWQFNCLIYICMWKCILRLKIFLFNFLFARYINAFIVITLTNSIIERTVYFTNWACDCFMLIFRIGQIHVLYIREKKAWLSLLPTYSNNSLKAKEKKKKGKSADGNKF